MARPADCRAHLRCDQFPLSSCATARTDSSRMGSAGSLMEIMRRRGGRTCPFARGDALACPFALYSLVAVIAGSPASVWWLPYILLCFVLVELESSGIVP